MQPMADPGRPYPCRSCLRLSLHRLGLHDDLDERRERIKTLAYGVSTKLRREQRDTRMARPTRTCLEMEDEQMNCDASEKANAQWRIKESQIFVSTRRFRDIMGLYNQDMITHRERYKSMIVRQLEICEFARSSVVW